ncbi:Alpha/Beta hydrolase protein [Lineolata rhizophorae]|uniref:Alpha/Beta hydrolase protein n=1 Tax=Lineolata rhizophorae TaxID=578093 RepID=A0A6A6NSE8_9PEZI|nr:Alpha/Beta hydrolase protein [Lineolata rhizophorae]
MTIGNTQHYTDMDPEFAEPTLTHTNSKFLKSLGGRENLPIPETVSEQRAAFDNMLNMSNDINSDLNTGRKEEEVTITLRDGATVPARVYAPKEIPADGAPLVSHIHGGGFLSGNLDMDEPLCREFCDKLGCVVVNLTYRLAPEHPFPIGIKDAIEGVKWRWITKAAKNGPSYGANPKKATILGGRSAGGNFAGVIAHLARDEGWTPPLTGLFLSVPYLLDPSTLPEKYKDRDQSAKIDDSITINKKTIESILDAYKPDLTSPLFDVFNYPNGHKNLPPTYMHVCGLDPLRDEDLIFEEILRTECDVKTRLDVYPGLPHGFWQWTKLNATKKYFNDTVEGMKWLVEQSGGA